MKINLGKVGYVSRGAWSNAETYYPKDIVQLDGSSWEAIAENTNIQPGTNGSIWRVFAAKGDTGKAFEYSDFTPEQIAELKRPATEAAETANTAAQKATTAAGNATKAADDANKAAVNANAEAQNANKLSTFVETAENTRKAAEEERVRDETARNINESARIKAENERKAAETSRVSAESLRQSAEQTRTTNEATRKSAEQTRTTNETTRQQNEQTRQTKESERQTAETKRDEAEKLRVTEFSQIKSDAETATKNANDAANNANNIVANALVKTEQELTDEEKEQVQTNIGVKDTVDAVGVEKQTVELSIWKDGYYRNYVGNNIKESGYFISNTIKVNAGDIIKYRAFGGSSVSNINEVLNDDEHTFIRVVFKGASSQQYQEFVADKDMYIELSGQKIATDMNIYISRTKIGSTVLKPLGGYNRALFEAARAIYNEETGYYELNGLIDITEEEMSDIYVKFYPALFTYDWKYLFTTNQSFRTNLKNTGYYYNQKGATDIRNAFQESTKIEVLDFTSDVGNKNLFKISNIDYAFTSAVKLRIIKGIDCSLIVKFTGAFGGCKSLEILELSKIKASIDLSSCSKLSKASILYLIQNSAATSAITITLHADAYAMAMADEDIQAALAEKEFVSLASA